MASSSRTIPHLLEPYLLRTETETADGNSQDASLEAEAELVIATSVLGASTNWLIQRYLYSFLKQSSQGPRRPRNLEQDGQQETQTTTAPTTSVVLVSFLRDFTFWKENAGRIGLDLEALTRTGRFAYVDGLGVDLFHSPSSSSSAASPSSSPFSEPRGTPARGITGGRRSGLSPARPNPIVPGRQPPGVAAGAGAIPLRGGPPSASPQGPVPVIGAGGVGRVPTSTSTPTAAPPSPASGTGGGSSLTNPTILHLRNIISDAIDKVKGGSQGTSKDSSQNKVVLIIDQLDFLLAASCGGSTNSSDDISTQALRELLLDLRETTTTTLLTLSADQPLIETDPQSTNLEKNHASFVLSLLHEANLVLSLRLLDTGVAKDVSGVIRITAGGGRGGGANTAVVEENEYLYHVRGDGSVRVFERGQ